MSPAKEECRNCRFWARRNDHAEEQGGGFCRRYPPSFVSGLRVYENLGRAERADHSFEIGPDDDFLNDAWPSVHQQSWCGEWRAKNGEIMAEIARASVAAAKEPDA